jgi:hypothetical protein
MHDFDVHLSQFLSGFAAQNLQKKDSKKIKIKKKTRVCTRGEKNLKIEKHTNSPAHSTNMNVADELPHMAAMFFQIVMFILPRDIFQWDRAALLRLAHVRKNVVEEMHCSSGAFTLDLHMSARNIVMYQPFPRCDIALFDEQHFKALKTTASRFRSIRRLCIDLGQLPFRCNFINTAQIVDLVFHCLATGRAKHLHIAHAIFEADQFTNGMRHLFQSSKNQILSVDLRHCKLAINSKFMRELASLRNLTSLTLDGNKFHMTHTAFPAFSDSLQCFSVASCSGVTPSILKKISKKLRLLNWSDNVILEADKQVFLDWITDSQLVNLDIDNCAFHQDDILNFELAFERMPALRSLSMAGNDNFQDDIFWWIYDFWKRGRLRTIFFSVYISNMHICYPDCGLPIIISNHICYAGVSLP